MEWRTGRLRLRSFCCAKSRAFHFERAAPDMKITLGERQLDPGLTKFLLDRKIEIAAIAARPGAPLAAPDDEIELDRVVAEFLKKNARGRIPESVMIFTSGVEPRLAYFGVVTSV